MHPRQKIRLRPRTLFVIAVFLAGCNEGKSQGRHGDNGPPAAREQSRLSPATADGAQVIVTGDVDVGMQINAAIRRLPLMPVQDRPAQHCGVIQLPTGKYVFAVTIVKPNCVTIEGNGAQLVYTGSTIAVAEAGIRSDDYANVSGGIDNLWLQGPGDHLGAGFGNTTGVLLGGDPSGAAVPADDVAYAQLNVNLHIEGFHTGMMLGGYSSLNSEVGGQISNNDLGIWAPRNTVGAGEQFNLYGVVINNNFQTGILNDLGYEIKQFGGSIDYTGGVPGQPFYTGNKFAISGINVNYEGHGVHFEQNSGPIINMVGDAAVLSLFGGTLYQSGKPGAARAFLQVAGPKNSVTLESMNFQSEHSVTGLIDWAGTGTAGMLTLNGSTGNYARANPVLGDTKAIAIWNVVEGNTRFGPKGVTSEITPDGIVQGQNGVGVIAGGVSWTTGHGAPGAAACVTGSLYSNLAGSNGTTLYVCENRSWTGR